MTPEFDAIIVGARCAGAATALLLARAGARVLVVDRSAHGTDTLSTHALMRGAVLQLHRWGVLPAIVSAGTPPVYATTFSYLEEDVVVPIEPRHGVSALYAPRRVLLDRVLIDAATSSGAEVEYGVRVNDVKVDEAGRVRGIVVAGRSGSIDAGIVIGADGLHSTIARKVGAPTLVGGRYAAGVLYTYWENFPVDGYYWGFRPGVSVGAIPTNGHATCVFVSVPSQRFAEEMRGDTFDTYHRLIREASREFADRFVGTRQTEPIRGFGGQPGFIKAGSGPGWALVGDSGYFKDPATAHGITDALRDAQLLARAILRGSSAAFAEYEAMRLDLSRTLFELTDEIASFAPADERLQLLHRAFSSEMSREVRVLAGLDPLSDWTTPAARTLQEA